MTDPSPLPYATTYSAAGDARDADHLRILSIMYYVWGGLVLTFSAVMIVYVVLGLVIASGNPALAPAARPGSPPQPSPAMIGYVMAGGGGCGVVCGGTLGLANILVGRRLVRRRSRTLAMVVAGFNCLSVPFGTVLGVFTFVVLGRDSVRAAFAAARP